MGARKLSWMLSVLLVAVTGGSGAAQMPVLRTGSRGPAVTLLQVALSDREFSSGPIDGRFGPELRGAVRDYQAAHGLTPDGVAGPAVWGDLGLAAGDPESLAFRTVTIDAADTVGVAPVPETPEEQAKLAALPYESVLERIAERYQASAAYVQELNPEAAWPNPPAGTAARVPGVKYQTTGASPSGVAAQAPATGAEAQPADTSAPTARATADTSARDTTAPAPGADLTAVRKQWEQRGPADVRVVISTPDEALRVYRGDALIARYPATVGSEQFPNPVGDWKIVSQVYAPDYRYDLQYLETGKRSENALRLPPGPNSIVGVLWMGLNKEGFGVHGTNDPASIGRRLSHGCVRLTNWDVERLAKLVGIGTPVVITDRSDYGAARTTG